MNRRRIAIATVVLLAAGCQAPASGQASKRPFAALLSRIPDKSNALLLVDVDGLYDSPIGLREVWRNEATKSRRDVLGVGPSVAQATVAAKMDFQGMRERWKVGMVQLKVAPPDLASLARIEGGYVDTIANTPIGLTPRGFALFTFDGNVLGFAAPPDRQELAAWMETAIWHPRNFAPGYADRAVNAADGGAQVVLALDLRGSVSAKAIEPWLNAIDVVKKTGTEPKILAARLEGVKSASLVVSAGQSLEGTLRFEFEQDVSYAAPLARTLVLELLEDVGADLPDVKTWNPSFPSKTVLELTGRISEESVRRIISLVYPPRLSESVDPTTPTEASRPTDGPTRAQNASQAYYRSVTSLIEGLKGANRPSYRSIKLWYDRYAKQIEELPILDVDRELLDWGGTVSRTMREMSSGINYYAQNQTYTLAARPNGSYGGYDQYSANSKGYDQAVIKKQSDAMMSVDLDVRWQAVETSVADMRRKMVEKYRVDF